MADEAPTQWEWVLGPQSGSLVACRPITVAKQIYCFHFLRLRRSQSAVAYTDQTFPWTICRSVRWSVCPVHCGKTADRIQMQFGIIGRMVAWMRQVVEFGDRSTGRGTFGGEFGARMGTSQKPISPSLCHHMATVMLSCCSVVPNSDKLPPDILARNVTLQPKV